MNKKRILLGHLNSMGDCLFSTVIARQIKEIDYPNCHLTWAVNSKSKPAVLLNPYVDEIWEIPTEKSVTSVEEWNAFVAEAEKKRQSGDFDFIFFTQIIGSNRLNYDGGIRSSTYNNYPHKIKVPHQPVIRLAEAEVENVRKFAEKNQLDKYKQVILVECGPDSFDAALNLQSAYGLALDITSGKPDAAVILSSNKPVDSLQPNIIDGSKLTFRENAELTKYCHLFIGCASGISWLATTNWAKKLNMILVINENNYVFPSMISDHKHLKLPTGHIIEIKSDRFSMQKLKKCLEMISADGFESAKNSFDEKTKLGDYWFLYHQLEAALINHDYTKFFSFLGRGIKRNGIQLIFTRHFGRLTLFFLIILKNKLLKLTGLGKTKTANQ